MTKQKVICFPIHPTSWPTMFKIAKKLKESGQYEPSMLLTSSILDRLPLCRQENIETYIFGDSLLRSDACNHEKINGTAQDAVFSLKLNKWGILRPQFLLKKLYKGLCKGLDAIERATGQKVHCFSLYQIVRAVLDAAYIQWYRGRIGAFLDQVQPTAVYITLDNLGNVFSLFAHLCRQRGIKLIIPAFAFYNPSFPAYYRRSPFMTLDWLRSPWVNYWIKKAWPDQFYRYHLYGGKELLFYLPYETLALSFCGILPKHPWIRGKSLCDIVCVEDFYRKEECVKSGIPEHKVKVTGHVDFDEIYRVGQVMSKEHFYETYGFSKAKKLIIIALPQLKEHGVVATWQDHWQELEFLVKAAVATGQNVLLALHPKMDQERYRFLETKYPCRICTTQTSGAIVFADIFMAGGSSTLLWSVLCGAVTVSVDFYGFGTEMFAYLKSIVFVKEKAKLEDSLSRLVFDIEYFERLKAATLEEAKKHFLPLDGKTIDRAVDLIEEYGANPQKVSEDLLSYF